jgi:hypothetical protein
MIAEMLKERRLFKGPHGSHFAVLAPPLDKIAATGHWFLGFSG